MIGVFKFVIYVQAICILFISFMRFHIYFPRWYDYYRYHFGVKIPLLFCACPKTGRSKFLEFDSCKTNDLFCCNFIGHILDSYCLHYYFQYVQNFEMNCWNLIIHLEQLMAVNSWDIPKNSPETHRCGLTSLQTKDTFSSVSYQVYFEYWSISFLLYSYSFNTKPIKNKLSTEQMSYSRDRMLFK
jgi:hypothetical protein